VGIFIIKPTHFDTNQKIMSSKILLEIINFARLSFNENPVRLNDFNSRINYLKQDLARHDFLICIKMGWHIHY
ncbi:hypothetical protein ACT453_57350, partial [Bacillus sp. D-CC]